MLLSSKQFENEGNKCTWPVLEGEDTGTDPAQTPEQQRPRRRDQPWGPMSAVCLNSCAPSGFFSISPASPPAPCALQAPPSRSPNLLPGLLRSLTGSTGSAEVEGRGLHCSHRGEGPGRRHLHQEQECQGARRQSPLTRLDGCSCN